MICHRLRMRWIGIGVALVPLFGASPNDEAGPLGRPNIVYILADDLGYGDVSCFHPESRIRTPFIDRLAAEGMRFTDAHSGSAVCTPTRYGILTGRYAWRTRLKRGVLGGYSPHLIEPDRLTVAQLLRQQGYRTACVGKWHLGLDWESRHPGAFGDEIEPKAGLMDTVDYSRPFRMGPTAVGFDRFFGIAASLDMPPYLFLRDDRTVGVPTTERTWIRKGPGREDFEAIDVLPALAREAVGFLRDQSERRPREPFFLYLPLNAPHTPIEPSAEFQGKSRLGPYGDFVIQVDEVVGTILAELDRSGLADDTLVVLTSDNGFSPAADLKALEQAGHRPSAGFRGHKADIFEGGHRIPFVARWPGKVRPGSSCEDTICLVDLMATVAEILGVELPPDAGVDSVSILPDLLGKATAPVREATVHHSINGSFAIRQGPWKLILCPDSGGWSEPRPGRNSRKDLPPLQLYHLADDRAESINLAAQHPEVVERLTGLLQGYVDEGRSTPGPRQPNDGEIRIGPPRS